MNCYLQTVYKQQELYCVIKIEGEAHVLTYCPLKIWLTTGRLKKRLIPIFATPDGLCGQSHYPSSIRHSYPHVVIITN